MTSTTGRPSSERLPILQEARRGRRPSDGPGGFTLLELIMVMLIVCTALAITAPALRDFWRSSRGRDGALHILALIRWARSQAVTEARTYALRFDVAAGTYRLEASGRLEAAGMTVGPTSSPRGGQPQAAAAQSVAVGGLAPLLSGSGRIFALPEGCAVQVVVTPGAEANCIRFYPNGRTDGVRILLEGPGPDQVDIAVPSPTEDFVIVGDERGYAVP